MLIKSSKRRFVRLGVQMPVTCRVKRAPGVPRPELKGYTVDISEGGLQVVLPNKVRPGSVIEVEFRTAWGPILIDGEVVRSEPSGGLKPVGEGVYHGIRFRKMTAEQRFAFETFFISLIEAAGLRGH